LTEPVLFFLISKKMKCIYNVFVFWGIVGSALALKFKDCGSKFGTVKAVRVTGCDTTPICDLPRETNVTFSVDFITKEAVTKGQTVVHGIIAGIPVPFPMDDPDACDGSAQIKCPLKSNQSYTYSSNIAVKSMYPKVKLVVKWEFTEQTGADVFCIELPAQIVDKKISTGKRTSENQLQFP